MKFEQYSIASSIKRSLEELGFKKPTDIQFKAIPSILKGDDVFAIAQTGTGKTAAFAIPVLHKLTYNTHRKFKKGQVQCLVMVPTRELAIQIGDVFKKIGKYTDIDILSVIGGVDSEQQIQKLQKGVDILIATPGRMFDLIHQGFLDLSALNTLILDEADLMLSLGFRKDIMDVLKHIPQKRQTLFFSATIDKDIKAIAYDIVRHAIRIQISPKDPITKNVTHYMMHMEMDDKRYFLERLIREKGDSKVLVFVRTKVRAERVAAAMDRAKIDSLIMHSGIEQKEREQILNKFKTGAVKLLITTDLNARGVDIPNVDFVLNYDIPDEAENYVHRIGRTGRGTAKGYAYSFCAPEEVEKLKVVEDYIGFKIDVLEVSKEEYLDTIVFTEAIDDNNDWRKLLEQAAKEEEELGLLEPKKKKGKKKK